MDRSPVPLLDIVIAGTEVFISRLGQPLARAFLDVFQVSHIFVANATEKPNRGDFRKNGLHTGKIRSYHARLAASLESVMKRPIAFGVIFLEMELIQI